MLITFITESKIAHDNLCKRNLPVFVLHMFFIDGYRTEIILLCEQSIRISHRILINLWRRRRWRWSDLLCPTLNRDRYKLSGTLCQHEFNCYRSKIFGSCDFLDLVFEGNISYILDIKDILLPIVIFNLAFILIKFVRNKFPFVFFCEVRFIISRFFFNRYDIFGKFTEIVSDHTSNLCIRIMCS